MSSLIVVLKWYAIESDRVKIELERGCCFKGAMKTKYHVAQFKKNLSFNNALKSNPSTKDFLTKNDSNQ